MFFRNLHLKRAEGGREAMNRTLGSLQVPILYQNLFLFILFFLTRSSDPKYSHSIFPTPFFSFHSSHPGYILIPFFSSWLHTPPVLLIPFCSSCSFHPVLLILFFSSCTFYPLFLILLFSFSSFHPVLPIPFLSSCSSIITFIILFHHPFTHPVILLCSPLNRYWRIYDLCMHEVYMDGYMYMWVCLYTC